jgi:hypothetical protein
MDIKEVMKCSLPINAHHDFYSFCEYALFRVYEVEMCSPEGARLSDLIEAEFELYKEGKHSVETLYDFLDTLDLEPAIPRYNLSLYLASLFIGEVMDASYPQGAS